MSNMKIVVLHEGDATARYRIDSATENIFQMVLARLIRRMRFSRKHDLNRASERCQDASQSVRVIKDQLRTLVVGEPSGESNSKRCGIQQRSRSHDPSGRDLLLSPQLPGALANKRDEVASQRDRKSTRLNSSHSQISCTLFFF